MRLLLAVALLLAGPARGCLFSFANLTAGPEGEALVTEAYFRLWDAVGASVGPEAIKKMVRSGNPFHVPEEAGADALALRRHLAELERLIRLKEWTLEPIRARLVTELSYRIEGQAASERAIAEVEKKNQRRMQHVVFPQKGLVAISPDGQLAALQNLGPDLWQPLFVHELTTGTVVRSDGLSAVSAKLHGRDVRTSDFTPDGQALVFTGHEKVALLPLGAKGAVWSELKVWKPTGPPAFRDGLLHPDIVDRAAQTANPDRIYYSLVNTIRSDSAKYQWFPDGFIDLKTGNLVPIDPGRYGKTRFPMRNAVKGWRPIAGTDELCLLVNHHRPFGMTQWVHKVTVSAEGKLVGVPGQEWKVKKLPTSLGIDQFTWAEAGRKLLIRLGPTVYLQTAPDGPAVPLFEIPSDRQALLGGVAPAPASTRVAIALDSYEASTPSQVVLFDLASQQKLAEIPLPAGERYSEITYQSDGRISVRNVKDDHLLLLNPDAYLEP